MKGKQSDFMIKLVYELRTCVLLLQTYGIVQEEGQVEYMTFVLSVEEDGPAYMAGLRPGKSLAHSIFKCNRKITLSTNSRILF